MFIVREEAVHQKKIHLAVLEFKIDCIKVMYTIVQKVQDKSPLKYPTMRQLVCLDLQKMFSEPEWCEDKIKSHV